MKILGVEFSSAQRSVAVLDTDSGTVLGSAAETGGREMKALGLVENVLRQAQSSREAIGCIAVGLGPGSYTGIRASISLAQGWQVARGVTLLGSSSVDVLAETARERGVQGSVHIAIDAQRNEFYLAGYSISATAARLVDPLRLVSLAEIQKLAEGGAAIMGPEIGLFLPNSQPLFPDAGVLARLAQGRTDFVSGDKLEPIYLRETAFVKAPPARVIPE